MMKKIFVLISIVLLAAAIILPNFIRDGGASCATPKKNITVLKLNASVPGGKINSKQLFGCASSSIGFVSCGVSRELLSPSYAVISVISKYDAWSKGTFF